LPDELRLILAFALGFGLTFATVPLAIKLAWRTNFLDRPVGYKKHGRPTPYLGGLGVISAFVVVALVLGDGTSGYLVPVLCVIALCALGTLDDRVAIGPVVRVAAEAVAAYALWEAGLGWALFDAGVANLALTIIWVVALVNAFNLMDNLDGATGTVGAVSAAGVGVLAATQGETTLAVLAFGLSGACLAFLRFNLAAPARVFLGDGGSMPIGFLIAAGLMAVPSTDGFGTAAVFAVVPFVGLVVLDTTLVVVSRVRRGAPVLSGGRDHTTHRLLRLLDTPSRVAFALGAAQAALCAAGFVLFDSSIGMVFAASTAYVILGAAAIALLEWPYVREQAQAATLTPAQQESGS
jgi:UDP-GlcNAc:undecaprenyl-phosphate/decaprenyl-phosphate GlcNAc-1-phosphate transferase